MKHAGDAALDEVEELLQAIRALAGVKEKKRGSFYRGGTGFLHFHEDPAGMFADLKIGPDYQRYRVSTRAEWKRFLRDANQAAQR